MLRLIKYEIKKLFSHKILLILFAIMLIVNVVLITHNITDEVIQKKNNIQHFVDDYNANPEEMMEYISNFNNQYEMANLIKAKKLGDPVYPENKYTDNDFSFFKLEADKIINQTKNYQNQIKESIRLASAHKLEYESLMRDYSDVDYSFEIEYQESIINEYSKLTTLEFPVSNVVGYDILFFYNGFGILSMIAIVIGGMLILIPENTAGTINILRVSKRGRTQTFFAKIIVAFIYALIVIAILSISSYLAVGYKIGYNGFSFPIQMVKESLATSSQRNFTFCPFNITVGQGLGLSLLFKFISAFTLLCIIIAISSLFINYIPAFILGFGFTGFNYYIATYNYLNAYDYFKNTNFLWSINGLEPIIKWRGIYIFGKCFPITQTILLSYLIFVIISIVLACILFTSGRGFKFYHITRVINKVREFAKNKIKIKSKLKSKPKSITTYELKKILSPFAIILLVIFIVAEIFLSFYNFNKKLGIEDKMYLSYMEQLEGEWTVEKEEYLISEEQELLEIINSADQKREDWSSGKLPGYLYIQYTTKLDTARIKYPIVAKLMELNNRLKTISENGEKSYFINEISWSLLKNTSFSFLYPIVIIFVFANVFAIEYKEGSINIQRKTKLYSKSLISKIVITILGSILIIVMGELIQCVVLNSFFALKYPFASAKSLSFFEDKNTTIFTEFFLVFVRQIIVSIAFALFTISVSRLTKKVLPTLAITSVIAFAPVLFEFFGYNFLNNVSLTYLLSRL